KDNDDSAVIRQWSELFPDHSAWKVNEPGYAELRASPAFQEAGGDETSDPVGDYFRWAAVRIQELHQQSPGAEIGVLVRRNSVVARLVHELTRLGVPASEEGGTPAVDSPAVLALMSLLHFASHPGCTVSRYHVANSPLGPLLGLLDWRNDELAASIAAGLRQRLIDEGYGRTIQGILESVREDCSERDLLRLQQVVSEAWKYDSAATLNPADFVRLLKQSRLSKAQRAPVRVMTVHQSKGLEFDVVVLPELDARMIKTPAVAVAGPGPVEPPDRVCIWRNKQIRSVLPDRIQDACRQTHQGMVREALCLLYVALTRAVHALHLFVRPDARGGLSYSRMLVEALTDDGDKQPDQILYESGDPQWYLAKPEFLRVPPSTEESRLRAGRSVLRLQPPDGGRRRGLKRRSPSRHDEMKLFFESSSGMERRPVGGRGATATEMALTSVDPRTRGTLMHAWFEQIRWIEGPTDEPDNETLLRIADLHSTPRPVAERLVQEFRSMLQQPRTRSVFQLQSQRDVRGFRQSIAAGSESVTQLECCNERPFLYQHEQSLISGTIDRLVLLREHGRNVAADIIDFKTDRLVGNVDEWVAARCDHYRSQLQDYRAAVSHCFRIDPQLISCRLVLLEADRVESIEE
ncbi:MAG: PD-(D/E)XK nuclease family protein, partial [Planctomycetaceae bacterium]|nr:PD-(D/E)XK nuclease family protein [Planctomycetaceae bacterium]